MRVLLTGDLESLEEFVVLGSQRQFPIRRGLLGAHGYLLSWLLLGSDADRDFQGKEHVVARGFNGS